MNEQHISDDPELAAGYVLGRIPRGERDRINAHLRECPGCRNFMEAEFRVASAARRLGRDEAKARLRKRLDQPRRATRVLAVAATIVSLVGIGVLTRQFLVKHDREDQPATLTDNATPTVEQEKQVLRSVPPAEAVLKESKRKAEAGDVRPQRREDEALSVAAGAPAARGLDLDRAKSAPSANVVGEVSSGETYWTEGVSSSSSHREEQPKGLSAAAEKKDAADKKAGEGAAEQQFVLQQRPAGELPVSQQNRQMFRNSIPTLVQQQGSQTLMTLYLDSLVDQNELARARVEQRGQDSLVIRMQNQSILYQLPANRNRQQVR